MEYQSTKNNMSIVRINRITKKYSCDFVHDESMISISS